RHGLDHVVGEIPRVRGSEPDPLQTLDLAAGSEQLAESGPLAEFHAIGVHVLAQQGHLKDAFAGERLDFGEDVASAAVLLPAAQRRDDTEGAGVVAPDGY